MRLLTPLALAGALLLAPAQAEWKPDYANQPFEVQQWYRNAELTPAAQARFPFKKCCDHSDVVRTKFKVTPGSGGDEWWWWQLSNAPTGGDWRRVPDDVIHWGEHAPNKQPTLFIYNGSVTCFFPGEDGN